MNSTQQRTISTCSRRDVLRQAGVGLSMTAATTFAPFVFSGCSRQRASLPSVPKVKVGILHSQTGTMSMHESSLRDAELLAIEEINADGGVLGHHIDPIVKDTRSGFTDIFPKKATELLSDDRVSTVFGCWTSSSRKAVVPLFERFNGMLFYPLQYEGNESSYNVVYSGSVPNQQIIPAVDWLVSREGGSKRRFYLVGSDYIFPWTAHHILEACIAGPGRQNIEIVGFRYLPLGHRDFAETVRGIQVAEPDVIFSTINGISNQYFFRELASQAVSAEKTPVISTSVGEDELRGMMPSHVEGQLATWHYFQSINTPRNRRFARRFRSAHGEDRVLSDPMEAAYSQVYLWKSAVEKAESFEVDAIRDAFSSAVEFHAPGGELKLDPKSFHAYKRCRIGRARGDGQFDIVYESPGVIPPDPYPTVAFPGWNCDWTRGGITQGEQVRISRPNNDGATS
ncbi:ABC transporter substrate-binding protein [Novipirellula artificiosorum]|uniref:Aliphatic amidase expression-regulating protein n=1 Tax=Novipirellula artificiosorum TaxID=2528016 RepID=A0A5C6DDI5_9BACT|nr:ABC transporter substrate-binding protein [Novipirellula artificiosorum]TWU33837.1 Aliphatic amidase expression-regulating protein [Novipirellula artificiosorum]